MPGVNRVSVADGFGAGGVPVCHPVSDPDGDQRISEPDDGQPISTSEPVSEPEHQPHPKPNQSVPGPYDLGTVADQPYVTADGASAIVEPPGSASTWPGAARCPGRVLPRPGACNSDAGGA